MLQCNETVTIVRLIGGKDYETEVITGCSWYDKRIASLGDKGVQMAPTYKVRIPSDRLPKNMPNIGDYIVRGRVPDAIGCIKDLQGYHYGKIMTVGDNRRGNLPHVLVVAG